MPFPNINEKYLVYQHQVAGHRFEDGKQGMLVDKDGTLLKPIQEPPRGKREVNFYQTVFAKDADSVTLQLRSVIPKFHGTVVKPNIAASFKNKFIKLEDVTRHFNKPCILDMKVGRVAFDHLADEAKRLRIILKYPEQELLGFRILGMKVYNKDLKQFRFYNKSFGNNVKTHHQVREALTEFFCPGRNGIGHILKILEQCRAIKKWFLNQRKFRLFSSSILIVYEGDAKSTVDSSEMFKTLSECDGVKFSQQDNGVNIEDGECKVSSVAKQPESLVVQPSVHLIDFAHAYIDKLSEADENYLFGLESLIQCLEQLVR